MTKELLIQYSKNPSAISSEQHAELKELLAKYPYSNLLQLLAASSADEKQFKIAIAYTNEQAVKKASSYTYAPIEELEPISQKSIEVEYVPATTPIEVEIEAETEILSLEVEVPPATEIMEELPPLETLQSANEEPLVAFTPNPTNESVFRLDIHKEIEEQETTEEEPEIESFTDWLKKTRQAKEITEQSAIKLDASAPIATGTPDELEKLYQENSYHLEALDEQQASKFESTNALIEKFITEDPHLKPIDVASPSTDNKAKKSTELPNSLITETLAQIYISQKYYSKAIMAYEKLSLKFPEKSAYFASLIQKIKTENHLN